MDNSAINTVQTSENIRFSPFLKSDKHFFGACFNLAQNNIVHVMEEFKHRMSMNSGSKGFNIVQDYFTDKISHDDWERGVNLLKTYFPVMELLNLPVNHARFSHFKESEKETERRKYFRNLLKELFKAVNDFRNFYTHFFHHELTSYSDDFYTFLDETLLNTIQNIKKERFKSDNVQMLLKERLKEDIGKKFQEKKKQLKEAGNSAWRKDENVLGAVMNDAFKHLVYKKAIKEKEKEKYDALKDSVQARFNTEFIRGQYDITPPVSKSGLLFLLSFFLHKKALEELMGKLEGYKRADELQFIVTRWIYTFHAFKGLKQAITTEFLKETLLVQVMDELSKIPDEKYRLLSESDKQRFVEDLNEYYKDNEDNPELARVIHPVIRKRYENRFAYFAIRYLDEFAGFRKLRFHVHIGNYIHEQRTKKIKGVRLETNRMIKEPIKVFGRLSEINKLKKDFFLRLEKTDDQTQWEEFPNPNYAFYGNNIGIYCKTGDLNEILHFKKEHSLNKTREDSSNRKSKKNIIAEIGNQEEMTIAEPVAVLSLNELPSLLYEMLVKGKTGEETEATIIHKIKEQFRQLKNGNLDNIPKEALPRKLRKSGQGFNWEKLEKDISDDIKTLKEKSEMILSRRAEVKDKNSKRKFVFYNKEMGTEAVWLADDFKRSMLKTEREQWKGYQHSELQKVLAYYQTNRTQLIDFFQANFDTTTKWGNRTNTLLKEHNSFDSFYLAYLRYRLQILSALFHNISGQDNEHVKLRKIENFWNAYQKQLYLPVDIDNRLKQILTHPVNLPRGIFDSRPTFITGKHVDESPAEYAEWFVYYQNFSGYQQFYDLQPDWNDKEVKKVTGELVSQNGKDIRQQVADIESVRRKLQKEAGEMMKQDVFLKLIADDLYRKVFHRDIQAELKDLFVYKADRREQHSETDKYDFIWTKFVPLSLLEGRIVEPNVKMKEIGKFRKLERDERVHRILQYDNHTYSAYLDNNWKEQQDQQPVHVIALQLDCYDRLRSRSIFRRIQELEKKLLERHATISSSHPADFETNGIPNFRKYIAHGVLAKWGGVSVDEIRSMSDDHFAALKEENILTRSTIYLKTYLLVLLRNKFAHNQLPDKEQYDLIQHLYPESMPGLYAEYLDSVTEKIISEIQSHLQL